MIKKLPAFLFFITLLISCERKIPDPPVISQQYGTPVSSGPCTVSFYFTTYGRVYNITVDGIYQATLGGANTNPVCGQAGTAVFHLSEGTHTFSAIWTDNASSASGGGGGSFSVSNGNCLLYQL